MGKKRGGRRGKTSNVPEEQTSKAETVEPKPSTSETKPPGLSQGQPDIKMKPQPSQAGLSPKPTFQPGPAQEPFLPSPRGRGRAKPSTGQTPGPTQEPFSPTPRGHGRGRTGVKPGPSQEPSFPVPTREGETRPGPAQISQDFGKLTIAEVEKGCVSKPGTQGRKIRIETNHLQLDLGTLKEAFLYDVSIVPDKPKKFLKVAMNLFQKAHYPNNHPSYDGQKLLFSARRLPFGDTIDGSVNFRDKEGRDREFKVAIKLTGTINLTILNNLLQKNYDQEKAFQCVEVVFRQAYTSSFMSIGRRFFAPLGGKYPVGIGGEMYLGGYQAAVKGWTTLLNVDVAHKAFTMAITIKDLILQMFQRMTENDLQNGLQRWQIEQLSDYLKGLRVIYQIPKHPSPKTYRINGFGGTPCQESFEYEGKITTVEAYFFKRWHCRLVYPKLPTLWVGSPNNKILVPLEYCSLVEGQPIQGDRMTETQTSAMIKYAATPTDERKKKIQNIIKMAGYNKNPCIEEFGFSVSEEFQKIDARILDPPILQYSNKITVKPLKASWKGKMFISGARIQNWTIVGVGVQQERVNRDLVKLSKMIVEFGSSCGMVFASPSPFSYIRNDPNTLLKYLEGKKSYDLVIVILPFDKKTYYTVKQMAELRVGCLTQCIKLGTLQKLYPSTIENILLKLNAKLSGTNHTICDLGLLTDEATMVMGADVTHPSPQATTIPSVVAVTGSHDLTATKYNICIRLQKPRTEIIEDLANITKTKLERFVAKTKKEPAKIFFWRDGVSDGEFERVKEVEIRAIQRGCEAYKRGYKPTITFLVVQKRHHTRFFPLEAVYDKNKNAPAGTCVDTMITDPTMQNFFLLSHESFQGVARPTKYCTLYDENRLTNDDVEKLTYYLCYVFPRCNKAVSYPAPTYCAHLAADRAKGYLHGKIINLDRLDPKLVKIKDCFEDQNPMFFV